MESSESARRLAILHDIWPSLSECDQYYLWLKAMTYAALRHVRLWMVVVPRYCDPIIIGG